MDVLVDILDSLRLTGGVVIDAETSGDFCFLSRFSDEDRQRFSLSPGDDLIAYHFVRTGRIFASVDGGPPVEAKAGDIILLPRNDSHLLFSKEGLEPVDAHDLIEQSPGGPARIVTDGDPSSSIFCGYLGTSVEHHPLIDSLPKILKLEGGDRAHSDWIASSMRLMNEGRSSPDVVARIAQLFFAEAVRRYLESLPRNEGGWLAGLNDPAVAKALAIIHSRYAEDLDVESLAREAGVSRSVLGERFVELIGEPPMRYCARWRMRVAANMLREGRQNASNVAYAVGFNSEAAFTRAFKREYGEPPATWRRRVEEEQRNRQEDSGGLPEQVVRYCSAKDGTRLAFSITGSGPPLVKAANWLNHIEEDWKSPVWRHWLTELTRDHCLVRYDERANGLSDWDTPDISFDAFVDDLESVVDCAGLETFDLLAISQGAAVAIAYAVRNPHRVRKLIICGGYACGWAIRGDAEEIAKREAMLTLTEVGWGADHPAYRQMFTNLYIPGGTTEQVNWWNEMQRVSCSPENAVRIQRALSQIDVRELLPKLEVPTLIFHSVGDQVVPFGAGEFLAKEIPGSTFVPLDSDNHVLLQSESAWKDFVRISREFLASGQVAEAPRPAVPKSAEPEDRIGECMSKDGVSIAFAESGDGFPVFKAPNWMTHLQYDWTSPVYGHWLRFLGEMGKVVRMDLRGFGMSEWEPADFSFEAMVADMVAVADAANVERCDMIGMSHGSALAVAFAARYPERVRRLVLVNGFAQGWRARADPEEVIWRESLLEMNRTRPAFRRSLLGEMFITLYFPSASEALIDWHNRMFQTLGPVPSMEKMIDMVSWIDVRDALPKIQAETLVLHSRQDGNAPVEVGREMAGGISGARFVEMDGSNHIILEDEPAWRTVLKEVKPFLRQG